jgi:prefoldin alpha subunit
MQELQQQMEALEQEKTAIQNEITELENEQSAINEAIEAIEILESGSTVQVPLGGGAHVRAEIQDIDEIVVSLGGGYAGEQKQDDAIQTLKTKKVQLDDEIDELHEEADKVESESNQLEQQAQQMQQQQMQQMQQQMQQEDGE